MDEQLAREYRNRWKAEAAIEAKEQRMASLALRWQQLWASCIWRWVWGCL